MWHWRILNFLSKNENFGGKTYFFALDMDELNIFTKSRIDTLEFLIFQNMWHALQAFILELVEVQNFSS